MLEYFKQMIPLLNSVTFGKGTIVLYDREKFISVISGTKIVIPVKVGDSFKDGSSAQQVIQFGKPVVKEIGAHVLGMPYLAVAQPIIIDGEVIGGLSVSIPPEMDHISENLLDTSTSLVTSLEQISLAVQNIAVSAQILAAAGQTVTAASQNVQEKAEETEKVVRYIDSVATNTKLLGLNASIEAARAGEVGRGFGVVANEIQKMAVSSTGSAKEIHTIVYGIRSLIGGMVDELGKFGEQTQEVSAAIEEISASISYLLEISQRLNDLAKKL